MYSVLRYLTVESMGIEIAVGAFPDTPGNMNVEA